MSTPAPIAAKTPVPEKKLTTITVGDVVAAMPLLQAVLKKEGLPPRVSYRFQRVHKMLERENRTFEEARVRIVKSIGKLVDATTDRWSIPKAKFIEYRDMVAPILEETIEFPFVPFSLEELGGANFTGEEMATLFFLIKDNENDTEFDAEMAEYERQLSQREAQSKKLNDEQALLHKENPPIEEAGEDEKGDAPSAGGAPEVSA